MAGFKPCATHADTRHTKDGRCVECESVRRADYRARNLEREQARRLAYRDRERELDAQRRAANPEPARERVRRYKDRHPDRVKANNAAQYAKNPDASRERTKQWRLANPEKHLAAVKAWKEANPEKVQKTRKQSVRKWRDKYPERAAHYVRQYQMNKRKAMPAWADRKAILAFYEEARRLTQETGIMHHVDHIFPISHPLLCGLHVETNLQVLPALENARKSNRLVALSA